MSIRELNIINENEFFDRDVVMKQTIFPNNELEGSSQLTDEKGIYQYVDFEECKLNDQGFKIHISCTLDNYREILNVVNIFCHQEKVTYKYIRSYKMLEFCLSSVGPRESGGKFITIYPKNTEHFMYLIEKLNEITHGFEGMHILNDRPYNDTNKVLHYRYGVINGGRFLRTPDGNMIEDKRVPYFNLPEFVDDPFPTIGYSTQYINKIYMVSSALTLKNSGGVYKGYYNGKSIIIKEARENTYKFFPVKSEVLKKNEANVLKKLQTLNNRVPKFIDEFYENGNYYIVEEFLEGISVADFRQELILESNLSHIRLLKIVENLLQLVNDMHVEGVAVGDISDENIIIDGQKVKLIDLEQSKMDKSTIDYNYYTKGFFHESLKSLDNFSQDWVQVGYSIISLFCNAHKIITMQEDDRELSTVKSFVKDLGIDSKIMNLIYYLISDRGNDFDVMLSIVKGEKYDCKSPSVISNQSIQDICSIILSDITQTLTHHRDNEEFYVTFPDRSKHNFFYGEFGRYCYDRKINIKKSCEEVILNKDFVSALQLMIIADEYGEDYQVLVDFISENKHILLAEENMSLISGLSGIGYLCNKINNKYPISVLVDIEKEVSVITLNYVKNFDWDSEQYLGLEDGLVGVLFYLSKSPAIKNKDVINEIKKAVEDLLVKGVFFRGEIVSLTTMTTSSIFSPYIQNGICGFLLLLMELQDRTGDSQYESMIAKIGIKYYGPCQGGSLFYGMAGLGYTSLKLYQSTGDEVYRRTLKDIITNYRRYFVRRNGRLYLPTPTFDGFGLDIAHGLTGVYLFFKEVIDSGIF